MIVLHVSYCALINQITNDKFNKKNVHRYYWPMLCLQINVVVQHLEVKSIEFFFHNLNESNTKIGYGPYYTKNCKNCCLIMVIHRVRQVKKYGYKLKFPPGE